MGSSLLRNPVLQFAFQDPFGGLSPYIQMAAHHNFEAFPDCSNTAACREAFSQPFRPALRSNLQAVRQQMPIQAFTLHAPVFAGRQAAAVRQRLHLDISESALSTLPASAALLLVTTVFGKGAAAADAANKKKEMCLICLAWLHPYSENQKTVCEVPAAQVKQLTSL